MKVEKTVRVRGLPIYSILAYMLEASIYIVDIGVVKCSSMEYNNCRPLEALSNHRAWVVAGRRSLEEDDNRFVLRGVDTRVF